MVAVVNGLTRNVAQLLRDQRERADLSQAALARAAGTSQQCLSRIEKGDQAARTDTIERLFEALGWQLRIELEALDADLDTAIDHIGEVDEDQRVIALSLFSFYFAKMAGLPHVIEGELGAILHGVPLKTRTLQVVAAQADLDALARWILAIPNCSRWDERWQDANPGLHPDPRRPGPLRWSGPFGQIRVTLLPELPEPVRIRVGDTDVPVRPLDQIADADPAVARILRRVRVRRGSP
jgi:Predicted transcriptional regulator with C-terminal CBS domains